MTRASWIKLLSFIFTLGIGVMLFLWFLDRSGTRETFATLSAFGFLPFAGFVLISLANFSILARRWQRIVNAHAIPHPLSFWSVIRHRMSGYATSYVLPAAQVGGEPVRVALLHKDGVPIPEATSSVILDIVLEVTGFVLYILLGLGISLAQHVLPAQTEWIVGGALLLVSGLLLLFFFSVIGRRGFFSTLFSWIVPRHVRWFSGTYKSLKHVEDVMRDFLHKNPRLLLWLIVLSVVTVAFRGVEVAYLAFFLGTPVGLIEAILLSSLPGLALLLPIPSGLGVLEGSTTGIVALLGLALNPVALVLLIRFRDLIFIVLGVAHMGHSLEAWLRTRVVQPVSTAMHRL